MVTTAPENAEGSEKLSNFPRVTQEEQVWTRCHPAASLWPLDRLSVDLCPSPPRLPGLRSRPPGPSLCSPPSLVAVGSTGPKTFSLHQCFDS